jgi:hypothetical protein
MDLQSTVRVVVNTMACLVAALCLSASSHVAASNAPTPPRAAGLFDDFDSGDLSYFPVKK